jgi:hypothetical protein
MARFRSAQSVDQARLQRIVRRKDLVHCFFNKSQISLTFNNELTKLLLHHESWNDNKASLPQYVTRQSTYLAR